MSISFYNNNACCIYIYNLSGVYFLYPRHPGCFVWNNPVSKSTVRIPFRVSRQTTPPTYQRLSHQNSILLNPAPESAICLMLPRLSLLARQLPRPLQSHGSLSAARAVRTNRIMTSSSANERNSRTIHTAACLIIGDEVLGGKVCSYTSD